MVIGEKHQKALLGGLERFLGWHHPDMIPTAVPKVLMTFYQADVLDEQVIKQWGTHVSKKYVDKETSKTVRKASEPFLIVGCSNFLLSLMILTIMQWLEAADDDEDEDEDDE